jgi:alpha-beta hydrolase superfamily lysophospholipase
MMKLMKWMGVGVLGATVLYLFVATALVFWPISVFDGAPGLSAQRVAAIQADSGIVTAQVYPFRARRFAMADGVWLFSRQFDAAAASTTVVLLHGVNADSSIYNATAGMIRQASGARVVALDLRGHGESGGRRWSVDYPGQYEDDVAQVISVLRHEEPHSKLVLAGHSMGGGIVLRYALKPTAPQVDGYLLIAPLLGASAPTAIPSRYRVPAQTVASFICFRATRFFGVLLFNLIGVKLFNDLPILYFNQPETPAYGFTALEGMQPNAPHDYRAAFLAINKPLLLVAGSRDEAFNASAYPAIVRAYSHGRSVIINGASHNGVTHDPRAIGAIAAWLKTIPDK